MTNRKILLLITLPAWCIAQTGCSLFFGNVKPSDHKSTDYGILDLSKVNPDWVKLDPTKSLDEAELPEVPESGVSDIAFQSKKTASIISINSACKSTTNSATIRDLKELTRELLLGISEVRDRVEKTFTLGDTPALQTTLKGKMENEEMMLETVVLKRNKCIYDLMCVTRPERFKLNEAEFSDFVSSLRLK
jgi:hypothetical protein